MGDWTKYFSADELDGGTPIENRNLAGVDLTGAELDSAVLTNCNFANAILRGATLNGARVFGCDFTGVDASGCEATGTSFDDMTWRGGRAVGADFGKSTFTNVDLRGTDFTSAVLRGTHVSKSDLAGTKLVDADLQRSARFTACDLRGADFDRALLGSTEIEGCAVYGIKGSPREPYDVTVANADLSPAGDKSRVGGVVELADLWRQERRPDPRRAPFEFDERVSDKDLEAVVLMQILDIRPELDSAFGATPAVFPVLVPWFRRVRVVAVVASEAKPQRVVCAAVLPDKRVELLEGSPQALIRAAAAEPVQITDADDALRYARFGT